MKYILKENYTGEITQFLTECETIVSSDSVTFVFDCKDSQFFSAGDKFNDDIFCGDVCEAFICTSGDRSVYYEIEVAPNNTAFVALITNKNDDIQVEFQENFIFSKVETFGNNYRVEFTVPFDKIGYDKKRGILFNAFRIETEGGIRDKNLLALNPTRCDTFHKPEFFVKLK